MWKPQTQQWEDIIYLCLQPRILCQHRKPLTPRSMPNKDRNCFHSKMHLFFNSWETTLHFIARNGHTDIQTSKIKSWTHCSFAKLLYYRQVRKCLHQFLHALRNNIRTGNDVTARRNTKHVTALTSRKLLLNNIPDIPDRFCCIPDVLEILIVLKDVFKKYSNSKSLADPEAPKKALQATALLTILSSLTTTVDPLTDVAAWNRWKRDDPCSNTANTCHMCHMSKHGISKLSKQTQQRTTATTAKDRDKYRKYRQISSRYPLRYLDILLSLLSLL